VATDGRRVPILDAIEGQPGAVALLRRALDTGRVAQAYAFVGPAGAGRMTTALALAAALLCPSGGCGACRACALTASRLHPDLHVVTPTPPASNPRGARAIRIGEVRELERQATLRPVMGARRVLVLDEAERMTGEAPQAFLKFLEEPPPGTTVVLVLPRVRAVPATVISRCQIVRFRAREETKDAELVAAAAALLEEARGQGVAALLRRTERVDRDGAEALIDGCWLLCRDLLLARAGAPPALLADAAHAEAVAREAALWRDDDLLEVIEACRQARLALTHNVTPRLTVETVMTRLARRAA
jgi:DNA polymerase-3 subunit delta'